MPQRHRFSRAALNLNTISSVSLNCNMFMFPSCFIGFFWFGDGGRVNVYACPDLDYSQVLGYHASGKRIFFSGQGIISRLKHGSLASIV